MSFITSSGTVQPPLTAGGVVYGNGTGAFTAATGTQIATAIGSATVQNATNATNATSASFAQTALTANTATSATSATASIYSDSAYTTLVESRSLTIPSSLTGLRYFVVKNANPSQNQSGSQTGWIDDISFWNDVTTPVAAGKYWSAQQ